MPPDTSPKAVLRDRLSAALQVRSPPATLRDTPAERLMYYSHELAFRGEREDVNHGVADGWVAEVAKGVAIRHFLIAQVPNDDADGWFPTLLATAARWRSHLSPQAQADVAMLLVAPSRRIGTGRIAALERNEAFAQVHVWAPGPDTVRWPNEADMFIRRLRLGPVEGPGGESGANLSPVDAVFTGIAADLRERWRQVLTDKGISAGERAGQLLAAADELGGGADDR